MEGVRGTVEQSYLGQLIIYMLDVIIFTLYLLVICRSYPRRAGFLLRLPAVVAIEAALCIPLALVRDQWDTLPSRVLVELLFPRRKRMGLDRLCGSSPRASHPYNPPFRARGEGEEYQTDKHHGNRACRRHALSALGRSALYPLDPAGERRGNHLHPSSDAHYLSYAHRHPRRSSLAQKGGG